ncbi:hypothetical protein HEK131_19790 [Streptomyces seoulensis]|nr:hypothetical protein HEK131_19790 [Streptomyces seoulensis]
MLVASVARVRLLVVVMRSVNQTGRGDRSELSTCWTAVDGPGETRGAGRSAVTRGVKGQGAVTGESASALRRGPAVANATVAVRAPGAATGVRFGRNKVSACSMP